MFETYDLKLSSIDCIVCFIVIQYLIDYVTVSLIQYVTGSSLQGTKSTLDITGVYYVL